MSKLRCKKKSRRIVNEGSPLEESLRRRRAGGNAFSLLYSITPAVQHREIYRATGPRDIAKRKKQPEINRGIEDMRGFSFLHR
ncbi:hypothetical protein KQX54_020146 [Cotesia glomerata]|uniref:Uncharacterized protein n=1 Tax=Cotesia glomerata TaxID=32391 RepID=A0AAV7IFM6_COTGL|nr:hypothetical protein KQX54_020146 [Cotesia glomerata]